MKWLKIRGSAALAALALATMAGVGTASASEPKIDPEDFAFPVVFLGFGGTGTLETTSDSGKIRTVHCTGNTSSGEINTANSAKDITVKFTGCTTSGPVGNGWTCTSSGASSGEIRTVALKGTLVYLTAGSSKTGMVISPESGITLASFSCKGIFLSETLTVTGGVIGELTPVNSLTGSFTLTFNQTGGHQAPETYLSSTGCKATKAVFTTTGSGAESFGPIQSGIKGTERISTSKKIMVTASSCS
jgi:hypothetical protein